MIAIQDMVSTRLLRSVPSAHIDVTGLRPVAIIINVYAFKGK